MKSIFALLATSLLLASCDGEQKTSNSSSKSGEPEDSSLISSSTSSLTPASTASSSSEESKASEPSISSDVSSSPSSSESDEEEALWTVDGTALPAKNPDSGTFHDLEFSTVGSDGEVVSFLGDCIRRGEGSKNKVSIDNTIQLSRFDEEEGVKGYFYMTSGTAKKLEFKILRNYVAYSDTDFSGVPAVYSADVMTEDNGDPVALNKEETADGKYYIYRCTLPHDRFRIETSTGNAMHIYFLSNLA